MAMIEDSYYYSDFMKIIYYSNLHRINYLNSNNYQTNSLFNNCYPSVLYFENFNEIINYNHHLCLPYSYLVAKNDSFKSNFNNCLTHLLIMFQLD